MNDAGLIGLGIVGMIIYAVLIVAGIVLTILWVIMPFVVFKIRDELRALNGLVTSLLGVLELTRREAAGMRQNQGAELDAIGRIERIQSAAHHIKFEE